MIVEEILDAYRLHKQPKRSLSKLIKETLFKIHNKRTKDKVDPDTLEPTLAHSK